MTILNILWHACLCTCIETYWVKEGKKIKKKDKETKTPAIMFLKWYSSFDSCLLMACSIVSTDETATENILKAQETYAHLCGHLGLMTPRDAFITALCKASLPPHYTLTVLGAGTPTSSPGGTTKAGEYMQRIILHMCWAQALLLPHHLGNHKSRWVPCSVSYYTLTVLGPGTPLFSSHGRTTKAGEYHAAYHTTHSQCWAQALLPPHHMEEPQKEVSTMQRIILQTHSVGAGTAPTSSPGGTTKTGEYLQRIILHTHSAGRRHSSYLITWENHKGRWVSCHTAHSQYWAQTLLSRHHLGAAQREVSTVS